MPEFYPQYAKLEVLKHLIDEENRFEYIETLKDEIDYLVKAYPNEEVLISASQLYTYDFNDFDGAVELATRAMDLYPSPRTIENHDMILDIKDFCD